MASRDPLVGTRIREYEILDVIGKGGMGAVYRARHIYLDEERAIKVIHAPLAGEPGDEESPFVSRFIREAKILTKLRHPDLVELYEFGRLDERMFFMVMELMKGESVHQRMKKLGRIPLVDALRIVREAANGLHVAHQKGIVHRDISPDNLMLIKTEGGAEVTKVIDFGIAKPTYQETRRYTIGDMFMGKPEFSSPEQCGFHEEGEEIDYRSDIYSLAVTLYYMLSGKLPFYSATPQGYLIKHASEPPKPISSHFAVGELPPEVEKLIEKALSKKREQRQSSMAEFGEEIDEILLYLSEAPTKVNAGELQPGSIFAKRYEVVKKIGRGGMGVVYHATDKFLDIPVALKTMNPAISDERTLNRLKREVILARKISHPNVCRIYDIGEHEGITYVSMELLEGQPLADILLKEGAMAVPDALLIIKQVLDAMEAAHSAGILHRDMKPQNIIIDPKGRAHIMDFGIATSADVSRLTQTGGLIGTPRYMSPEQFSGAKVDQRADIYSIGIILFEILTGALPYEANTPASVMYAHLNFPPKKPTQLISDLPVALENVILKALEKDPANRFQSVVEFRNALEPFLNSIAPFAPTLLDPISTSQSLEMKTIIPETVLERPQSTEKPQPTKVPAVEAPVAVEPPLQVAEVGKPSKRNLLIGVGAAAVIVIGIIVWIAGGSDKKTTSTAEKSEPQKKPAASAQSSAPPAVTETTPPPTAANETTSPPSATNETTSPPTAANETAPPPAAENQIPAVEAPKEQIPAPTPGVPEYTVEVVSSAWKARAEEKMAGLKEKGYSPYVAEVMTEKGKTYRVRVGRFKNYSEAKDVVSRLKTDQINAWVAEFVAPSAPTSETTPSASGAQGVLAYEGSANITLYNGDKILFKSSEPKSVQLAPGNYKLTIVGNEKALIRDVQTVQIKSGETTKLQLPEMASLTLSAAPSNCKVYIDGAFVDSPPIFNLPVQAGVHRLRVAWEKQEKEVTSELSLTAGESKTLRAVLAGDMAEIH